MQLFKLHPAAFTLLLAALPAVALAQTTGYNPNYYHPVAPVRQSGPPCGHYGTPACPPDPNAPRTTADAPAGMTGDALVTYSNQQIARGDKIGGLKTLERAAAQGNVTAMRGAGLAYVFGQTGVTDVPKGMALLEQAAATGDRVALFHLGHLYEDGTAVQADEARAIRYLNSSAEKRFWYAEFILGLDYTVGRGVSANRATALNYMARAAQDTREDTPGNYLAFLRKSGAKRWTSVRALSDDYFSDYVKIHTPPPPVYGPIEPGSREWWGRITGASPACHAPGGSAAPYCGGH